MAFWRLSEINADAVWNVARMPVRLAGLAVMSLTAMVSHASSARLIYIPTPESTSLFGCLFTVWQWFLAISVT